MANMFDHGNGLIDWKEFLAALRPDWEERPTTEEELIHDEVKRQVQKCTCRNRFKVHQVGEGQYRVSYLTIIIVRKQLQENQAKMLNSYFQIVWR